MSDSIEAAAKAIFELNPAPYSWTTWEERLKLETENRGDKSWSGPVKRSREHAAAALDAALPHLTEGMEEVIAEAQNVPFVGRNQVRIAAAITEELKRMIEA